MTKPSITASSTHQNQVFVLLVTDVLSVIYLHKAKTKAQAVEVSRFAQGALSKSTNRANGRNDWSDWFTTEFHPEMMAKGFGLAQDIGDGHTWVFDIANAAVQTAYSFCPTGTDPNKARVTDVGHSGKLDEFLRGWASADSDTPACPEPEPAPNAPKAKNPKGGEQKPQKPQKRPPATGQPIGTPKGTPKGTQTPQDGPMARARALLRAGLAKA